MHGGSDMEILGVHRGVLGVLGSIGVYGEYCGTWGSTGAYDLFLKISTQCKSMMV